MGDAMQEELLQFEIQKVWILVDLPFGKKAIGTKWVYRNKKDKRGIVVRNKAMLVAQGHRQEEGIDYDEVFAPVARLEAIRIFLAFASYMGFIVYQMDVKSAFLYGKIDEEVYCDSTTCFLDPTISQESHKEVKLCMGYIKPQSQMSSMEELTFFLRLQVDEKEDVCLVLGSSYQDFPSKSVREFSSAILEQILTRNPQQEVGPKSSTMAVLDSCPKHNMVAYLEKSEGNAEFHEIIDFLKRSSIHHALTVSPVVSTTFVEQFWTSAKTKPTQDEGASSDRPSEAHPTPSPAPASEVPNEPQTDSSPAQTSECYHQISQGNTTLEAQITKLKKQAKHVINTKSNWRKVGLSAQRFQKQSFSKKHRVHKESVSKQGRKFAKGESSVQRDPMFDEIPKDTVDHMETENAHDEGRTRETVDEDKEIDENTLSTEDVLSTDKEGVSTDMEKVSTDRPIVSTDGSKVSTDRQNEGTEEHIEGTEEHNEGTEEHNEGTEEQIESTDGQRKGTEDHSEEGNATQATQTPLLTYFEEWEGEEERNRIAEEKAANEALIRNFDDIKARIEADRLLAEKLQEQEREQFTIEERAKFLHDTIAAQRRFLAQQRSEAIRNRPPTKNQLRNQMRPILKAYEDFISIGSAEDERLIKRMNEKGVDSSKSEVIKEESKEEVQKESKEEESTRKRKLGTRKKIKSRKRRFQDEIPEVFNQRLNIVREKLEATWFFHEYILRDEKGLVIHMLVEKKYPLRKEVLMQMLKLKLESKEDSTMALELIRLIKKILAELEPEEQRIPARSYKQTALGKDFTKSVYSYDADQRTRAELLRATIEAKLTHAVNQQTSAVTTAMTAILKQFQATPPPASVKAVEEICVTCGGAHPYYQCLAADGNTFPEYRDNIQGYVAAAAGNYNQGNSGYRPPGVANQTRPPGFAQQNVQNNQNRFSQPQGYNRGNNFNQNATYQAPIQQNQSVPLSELEKIKKMNDVNIKAMQAQINNVKNELRNEMQNSIQTSMSNQTNELKNMMASFFQMNTASTSGTGSLPSNTIANPKGELKAITTRSGLVLDGPTVPMPPPFVNPEEDERVEETLTDPEHGEFTIKVPPPLVQKAKPPSQRNYVVHQRDPRHPHIPYPSRMNQEK
ncbi:reverse transcriptase domain-containing protein [Tanacetum coccineum]